MEIVLNTFEKKIVKQSVEFLVPLRLTKTLKKESIDTFTKLLDEYAELGSSNKMINREFLFSIYYACFNPIVQSNFTKTKNEILDIIDEFWKIKNKVENVLGFQENDFNKEDKLELYGNYDLKLLEIGRVILNDLIQMKDVNQELFAQLSILLASLHQSLKDKEYISKITAGILFTLCTGVLIRSEYITEPEPLMFIRDNKDTSYPPILTEFWKLEPMVSKILGSEIS